MAVAEPLNVAICIGKQSVQSSVVINGVDVSNRLMGVEIKAFVGDITRVTLHLSASVDVTGEAGEILMKLPIVKDDE